MTCMMSESDGSAICINLSSIHCCLLSQTHVFMLRDFTAERLNTNIQIDY